jgi:hypothetical protein
MPYGNHDLFPSGCSSGLRNCCGDEDYMNKLLSQMEAIFSIFLCDRLLVRMGCIIADPTDNSSPTLLFLW